MNKEKYLEILRNSLKNISEEEKDNVIRYYTEYFEDAGVENEDKVINELGRPELLANKISADYIIKDMEGNNDSAENIVNGNNNSNGNNGSVNNSNQGPVKKKMSNLWIIVLAVCAFPIWFPLGIAAAAILFSAIIVVVSLLFAFGVMAVAMVGGGLASFVLGIIVSFTHFPTGIAAIGMGCLIIGAGSLFLCVTVGVYRLVKRLFLAIAKTRVKKGVKTNDEIN